jgi:RNase P/RNase MRP subunit POP5
MARAGIQLLPETWKDNTAVLRVGHKYVDETKAALALIKECEGKKITISATRVSGTIEGVR